MKDDNGMEVVPQEPSVDVITESKPVDIFLDEWLTGLKLLPRQVDIIEKLTGRKVKR